MDRGSAGEEVCCMTLKEELEILRGEPIEVFEGDPLDIPCIETSDPDELCKNPVVSVHMITYNHEPFIRQAIEGVMMQKTDFEFELVIGEDCSQDKTREICFEYQKKYPDKIRVLWWHENVSRLGGNSRRNRAHCRGEFIAFCEGDDYWIDPMKLQKQVNVMRANSNIGLCFSLAKRYREATRSMEPWQVDFPMGANPGISIHDIIVFQNGSKWKMSCMPATATALYRVSAYEKAVDKYPIFKWCLRIGDTLMWLGISLISDVHYIPEETAVYRLHANGVSTASASAVAVDGGIVREYFIFLKNGINYSMIPYDRLQIQFRLIARHIQESDIPERRQIFHKLFASSGIRLMVVKSPLLLYYVSTVVGIRNNRFLRVADRYIYNWNWADSIFACLWKVLTLPFRRICEKTLHLSVSLF